MQIINAKICMMQCQKFVGCLGVAFHITFVLKNTAIRHGFDMRIFKGKNNLADFPPI